MAKSVGRKVAPFGFRKSDFGAIFTWPLTENHRSAGISCQERPILISPVVLSWRAYQGGLINAKQGGSNRKRSGTTRLPNCGPTLGSPISGGFDAEIGHIRKSKVAYLVAFFES